jgi:hypothetical protein
MIFGDILDVLLHFVMKIFTTFLNVTHLCIKILAHVNIRPYSTLILFLKRRVISNCTLKKKEVYCAVVIYASFNQSNITPVLGEDISPLKIQFGIRRYLYEAIHACFKSKYVHNN